MSLNLDKLNKAQKEAVERNDSSLLIVAGAGTGKTTVIAHKIAYILEKGLAKPEEILALTFTDKSADEMTDRVNDLLDSEYLDMRISTFHSFCRFILEKYGLDIGIPNRFNLLTETDAWLLFRKNLRKFDLDYYRPIGNPGQHIHNLITHFQKCKDELITPEDYFEYAENKIMDSGDMNVDEKSRMKELSNAYHLYNQMLLDNNSLDFADLHFYVNKLLEKRPLIKEKIADSFKFILVDEFQDVNWSQYVLVKSLLGKNGKLTVVGDDDQSIYAFRGASVSNILRFKEDFSDAKEVVLNQNYRSNQNILDTAYKSIQNNNPDRLEKKLKINKKLEALPDKPGSGVVYKHFLNGEKETDFIIEKIKEIKQNDPDVSWDDFAILARAKGHLGSVLYGLERAGLPYEFISNSGLFKQPVVLDCVNFLRLTVNHYESKSFFKIARMPFLEYDIEDLHKILRYAEKQSLSFYQAFKALDMLNLATQSLKEFKRIFYFVQTGIRQGKTEKPTQILYSFLENSGYMKYLAKEENSGNRAVIRQIYQLKKFFEYLENYEKNEAGADVKSFMEYYDFVLESGDDGELYQPEDTPDSINVMSVHKSKGLEFKNVFVINLSDSRFPSRERSEAIEIPEDLIKEQLPEGNSNEQEERRLFYVALTRGKENVFLLSSDTYGGVKKQKPSRFLAELEMISFEEEDKKQTKTFEKIKQKEKFRELEFNYLLPKEFSFSQIKDYRICPYKYKLSHILKLPQKGNASLSFGSTMHNTLQKFYEKIQEMNSVKQSCLFDASNDGNNVSFARVSAPSLDELLKIYEENFIGDWFSDKRQKDEYFKKGKNILKLFYKSQDNNWTVPVMLEQPFKIKVGDHIITGRIDRIDRMSDGKLEIIDYKTSNTKKKDFKPKPEDKEQLFVYAIAMEKMPIFQKTGQAEKMSLYYLDNQNKESFPVDGKKQEKVREKIIETIDAIKKFEFAPAPDKFVCSYCNFKDICEYRQ